MLTDEKLPRREFLRLGVYTAAAAAGSGLLGGVDSLFAASSDGLDPLLSVGYVANPPENGTSARLVDAGVISSGDPLFLSRSALVTITDYSRAAKYRGGVSGNEIDAVYPAHGYTPEKFPKFRAWIAVTRSGEEPSAANARFTLPVTSDGGALFAIRRLNSGSGNGAPWTDSLLRFSLGVESGTLKLQRGVYVVAFRESPSDSVPNWAGYRIGRANGAFTISPAAPFSYVVVSIDYAS